MAFVCCLLAGCLLLAACCLLLAACLLLLLLLLLVVVVVVVVVVVFFCFESFVRVGCLPGSVLASGPCSPSHVFCSQARLQHNISQPEAVL